MSVAHVLVWPCPQDRHAVSKDWRSKGPPVEPVADGVAQEEELADAHKGRGQHHLRCMTCRGKKFAMKKKKKTPYSESYY
mmetsp:Transcript_10212/g.14437  ORF Transcript_10212/g.14437 Transcript_10212/m.14437 type:complete len:80 (-) Transcript_10212:6-245(-)